VSDLLRLHIDQFVTAAKASRKLIPLPWKSFKIVPAASAAHHHREH